MRLQRLVCRVVFMAFAAGAALPAAAALRMTVTTAVTNHAKPGATAGPDTVATSEVVLAEGWISSRSGDTTVIYDFARRRRIVLDEGAKTRDDYSLFDVVGFRELELRNRAGLRQMASAGQFADKLASPLEDEHELSIQDAAPTTAAMRSEGADQVFASGDVILLRHGRDASPVGAAEAERFVQYLRYSVGGHPGVLAALQQEQGIPSRIAYYFHPAWGERTVALTIGAVRHEDAPAAPALEGYAVKAPPADATSLDALLDRAWVDKMALAARLRQPAPDAVTAQMAAQRPIDAWLMMIELQLSGLRLPPVSAQQKQAFQGDATLRTMAQAVGASNQDAMRQAAGALQVLRSQVGPRRYLLRLFEANHRVTLGELPAARALFADVLQANPTLAGAYKDIGDFYLRSFDTPRAWRSWEVARVLAPMFPNLQPVAQYERTLATRYPAYFR